MPYMRIYGKRLDNDKAVTFRINKNSSIVNIRLNDIVYIESFKNNQYIHIAEEREPSGFKHDHGRIGWKILRITTSFASIRAIW